MFLNCLAFFLTSASSDTSRLIEKLEDKQTNRQTDKRTNRQTDKWTNRQTNGQRDKICIFLNSKNASNFICRIKMYAIFLPWPTYLTVSQKIADILKLTLFNLIIFCNNLARQKIYVNISSENRFHKNAKSEITSVTKLSKIWKFFKD